MAARVLFLAVLLFAVSDRSEAQTCGSQASFQPCEPGTCCSEYGYCGTTSAYCGSGCQSQCNQQQCGIQASSAGCESSSGCCSRYGFCGTGSDYCGDGCQSGACTGSPVTPVKLGYWFYNSASPASNIDSCLYTHLLYAFATMDSSTFTVSPPADDNGQISTFVSTVRGRNPNVKTVLSIGGGSSDSSSFSAMASSYASRSAFISSSIALARQYNFDGLDLDWEYPTTSTDMANLGLLFQEWREKDSTILLAAACYYTNPLPSWMGGSSYPVTSIQDNLDWVLVMSYDLHGTWESTTNNPAPLSDPSDPSLNGDYGFTQWLKSLDGSKLVYGVPAYGYAWTLSNPSNHGTGAPATGGYDSLGNTTTYASIASFVTSKNATVVHNTTTVSTYAYSGSAWIGYDDAWSIAGKVNYVKNKNLRGYGFWTVLSDDSSFTLATAAAKALDGKFCNGSAIPLERLAVA